MGYISRYHVVFRSGLPFIQYPNTPLLQGKKKLVRDDLLLIFGMNNLLTTGGCPSKSLYFLYAAKI